MQQTSYMLAYRCSAFDDENDERQLMQGPLSNYDLRRCRGLGKDYDLRCRGLGEHDDLRRCRGLGKDYDLRRSTG
jgi:hypothetical protein